MVFLFRDISDNWTPAGSGCVSSFPGHGKIPAFFRLLVFIIITAFFFAPRPVLADQLKAHEYQVKAAFLLNFANFVQWPAGSLTEETFTIGILGHDPFGSALDALVGKTVRGRRVVVKRYDDPEDARQADIIFISASERRVLPQILKILRGRSILTVGDSKDFGRSGVIINMLLLSKRVGFEINLATAQREGLQISSHLLKLAQEVIE